MDQKPPQQPFSPHELTGQPANCPWAYFSLLFGLLSPVVLCFCGLSLLTSIIAIVTGHVSLARIRNSYGELQGVGDEGFGAVALVGRETEPEQLVEQPQRQHTEQGDRRVPRPGEVAVGLSARA